MVHGVEKQVDKSFLVGTSFIKSVGYEQRRFTLQIQRSHLKANCGSRRTVCPGKQTENNFVSQYVPLPLELGFPQPPSRGNSHYSQLTRLSPSENSVLFREATSGFSPGRDSAPQKRMSLLKKQNLLPPAQLPFWPISSLAELRKQMEIALHSPLLRLSMSL